MGYNPLNASRDVTAVSQILYMFCCVVCCSGFTRPGGTVRRQQRHDAVDVYVLGQSSAAGVGRAEQLGGVTARASQ